MATGTHGIRKSHALLLNSFKVAAVVTFGDPFENLPLLGILQTRRKTFCNPGDAICRGLPIVLLSHLTYAVVSVDYLVVFKTFTTLYRTLPRQPLLLGAVSRT